MKAVCKRRSKVSAGFSLIELLIVVAIILVIAAIAIPNFLKTRMRANETSAVASLRVIITAQATYQSTYSRGFVTAMEELGPPPPGSQASATAADLIDAVLASKIKSGYSFVYAAIDLDGDGQIDAYTVNANPISPGQTGDKYFYADQKGVIRYALGGVAGPTSDPVPTK